jgi:putative DNA primase/helicase
MTGKIAPTEVNIRAALSHCSPDVGRAEWVRLLVAVKDALGEAGRDIAEAWSQGGGSFDKTDFRDTWKSIKTDGKVTVGTLFYLARQNGWTPDGEARQETESERLERERQRKARAEQSAKEKARKERQAAAKASMLWKTASPAQADHPYLSRKDITPVPTLREIPVEQAAGILEYLPKSEGEPLSGRLLVVPVKIDGKLTTAELIDEEGRKSAIAGGPKSGGYWAAQSLPKGDGAGLVVLIGEGVATVLSAREATGHVAIAALSSSNLPKVAKALRERYPAARLVILGDIGGALEDAEQAAKTTGAALAVPDFGGLDASGKDNDFSDLHRLAGLGAVRGQIEKALSSDRPKTRQSVSEKTAVQPIINNPDRAHGASGTALCGAASSGSVRLSGDGTAGTRPGDTKNPAESTEGLKAEASQAEIADVPPTLPVSHGTGGTHGTALNSKASGGSAGASSDGTGPKPGTLVPFPGTGKRPPKSNGAPPGGADPDEPTRPSYVVREEWNRYGPPGVWFHGYRSASKGKDPEPLNLRLCSPLYVEAVTCTDDGRNFGRFLRFRDTFGHWRTWAMPMEMLRGSCEEVRGELLAAGVLIEYQERARLADYLQWKTPERRITAAIRTGWTRDGTAFVLLEEVIGSEDVYYQSETMHSDGAAEKGGDFDTWRAEIAARCVGNPVLALSLCVALAGPLLAKVQRDSGGIHWIGDSSTGKTTALNVGCSVWGSETFRRTWRATANGLEGAAAALNDTCLCLDEINEADPKEIGSIVYALGNGTGKTRANRIGSARHVFRWRLTLLSTGELTLAAQMAEGGKQPKAGQLVRLLNVPAARAFGAFDNLHGFPDGRALADQIKTLCGRHYGYAGPAFIEALLKDGRDFGAALAAVEALEQFKADNSQEGRGAARFALYGMAGELAQEWGILPWPEGEALNVAAEGYRLWREARGGGFTEDRQILRAVADFISRHGDSRFSRKAGDEEDQREPVVMHRAGWWIDLEDDGGRVYLFTSEALREATRGHDFARALTALEAAGWIQERSGGGEKAKKTAIGKRKLWLYWILPGDLDE